MGRATTVPSAGLVHAFGVSRDLGVFLLEDNSVLHVVGRSVVSRPLQPHSAVAFVHTLAATDECTAMALSTDGRFLAIATSPAQNGAPQPSARPPVRAQSLARMNARVVTAPTLDLSFPSSRTLDLTPPPPPSTPAQHYVSIINVATRQVVACCRSEMETDAYVYLAFSSDGTQVLGCAKGGTGTEPAPAGGPLIPADAGHDEGRCVISIWEWRQERQIGTLPLLQTPTAMAFKPNESEVVSISPALRMYRLNEAGRFKSLDYGALRRIAASDMVSHAWISSAKVVSVTASGLVALVADHYLKQTLQLEAGRRPTCIAAPPLSPTLGEVPTPPKGSIALLVGCADGSIVLVYNSFKDDLVLGRTVCPSPTLGGGPVLRIHIGAKRDTALVLCDAICALSLGAESAAGPGGPAGAKSGKPAGAAEASYDPVLSLGHAGPVLALSACVSRPIFFSVGADRTVRSYETGSWRSSTLAEFGLDRAPTHLSAHPSGMLLLLGFCDAGHVTAYHLSWSGMLEWDTIAAPGLHDLRYSTGGAHFAVATGNEVAIYSAYTLARLGVACAHGSPILSVCWAPDDATLATGAADGMVYVWRVHGLQRAFEHRLRMAPGEKKVAVGSIALLDIGGPLSLPPVNVAGVIRNSLVPNPRVSISDKFKAMKASVGDGLVQPRVTALAVGSDGGVSVADQAELVPRDDLEPTVRCVAPLGTVRGGAVFGTADGRLWLAPAGLTALTEFAAHSAGVRQVAASPGDEFVLSAGADGAVFVLAGPGAHNTPRIPQVNVMCETRETLASTETALAEAQLREDQLEADHSIARDELLEELEAAMAAMRESYEGRLQTEAGALAAVRVELTQERSRAEKEAAEAVGRLERLRDAETAHLEAVFKREVTLHEGTLAELGMERQERALQLEVAAEAQRGLEASSAARAATHAAEAGRVTAALTAELRRTEEGAAVEVAMAEEAHGKQVGRLAREAAEMLGAAQGEATEQRLAAFAARKKTEQLQTEHAGIEAAVAARDGELALLRAQGTQLQAVLEQQKIEMAERDHVLGEREMLCVVLREGQQRLEATVGVLQFRIKELELERAPLALKLAESEREVGTLGEALQEQDVARRAADETSRVLSLRHKQQLGAAQRAEGRAADSEAFVRSTYHELYTLTAGAERSWDALRVLLEGRKEAAFRQGLRHVGGAASAGERAAGAAADAESLQVQAELKRQRDHGEGQRAKLERRLEQVSSGAGRAIGIERSQSVTLLGTNFDLAKHAKDLEQRLHVAEAELKERRRKDARSASPRRQQPPHPTSGLTQAAPSRGRGRGSPLASRPLMPPGPSTAARRPLTASSSAASAELRGSISRFGSAEDLVHHQKLGAAEMTALENQRLRKNLLFFSRRNTRDLASSSMPLPPV